VDDQSFSLVSYEKYGISGRGMHAEICGLERSPFPDHKGKMNPNICAAVILSAVLASSAAEPTAEVKGAYPPIVELVKAAAQVSILDNPISLKLGMPIGQSEMLREDSDSIVQAVPKSPSTSAFREFVKTLK
jgi:hypothetical protein